MRLHPALILSMLLVACEKQEQSSSKTGTDEPKTEAAPAVTKSARATRETPLDGRKKAMAALEVAKQISDPDEREKAISALVWENLETNPKAAMEAFAALESGTELRAQLIEHMALGLTEKDPEQAIQWAKTLRTPEETSGALSSISVALADSDPARAATILSESGMAGRDFDVAVVGVVQRWAGTSPADAAAWVVMFDAGEARSAGIKAITSSWAQNDMPSTLRWIDSLRDPVVHQEAVTAMAEAFMQMPPFIQEGWAAQVTPEVRKAFEKMQAQAEQEAAGTPP